MPADDPRRDRTDTVDAVTHPPYLGDNAARSAADDLLAFAAGSTWPTVYADPPWVFQNRTGKMAPEHRRLFRYPTMTMQEIMNLPVAQVACREAHLYLWVPNALLAEGLETMRRWGFTYKTNLVWHKVRRDGGPDGRGVGFYFRNVTELVLFGVRGGGMRTLEMGRTQVNYLATRKREHSRKPDEMYEIIEGCSPGPYLELFQRGPLRPHWSGWGAESNVERPNGIVHVTYRGGPVQARIPGIAEQREAYP